MSNPGPLALEPCTLSLHKLAFLTAVLMSFNIVSSMFNLTRLIIKVCTLFVCLNDA